MAVVVSAWCAVSAHGVDNTDCFVCHADKGLVKTNDAGKALSLFVDGAKFGSSIHGKNLCTSCHSDITELPHPEKLKPVSCSACHRIETDIYLKSDHGLAIHKGVTEAASCKSCHGASHDLLNSRDPHSPVHRANLPATCAQCHGQNDKMEKFRLRQRGVTMTYDKSAHGLAHAEGNIHSAVCTDCHGSHDLHRATNPQSKLYWQNIPSTCGRCHENVRQTFARSTHGKAVAAGVRDAPVCTDCHGEHTLHAVKQTTSKVAAGHVAETCGQCHGTERIATRYRLQSNVVSTYMQSFHGLAMQFGGVAAANCASCHGFHDILPSEDPLSSVNPANLPQTCGKCHPGIGMKLTSHPIRIHAPPGAAEGKPWVVNFITRVYIGIIFVTIGGMILHNLLDYFRKTRQHVQRARTANGEPRLSRLARAQHITLISLFALLAYTGFVHKFPDAFWSWPFRILPEGGIMRGMIHRIAGWLFAAFFGAHLVGMFATANGRQQVRALWLCWHDLADAFAALAYNVGLRRQPPPHRRWSYVEKSEYWALVWGSLVMIVTGLMLIFTETVLRLLPKVWHDAAQVIHFYEALLATLAIVVWHFYAVIFDPKEYPMNPAWLIGKKSYPAESDNCQENPTDIAP